MLTTQQVFDKVATHLLKQGKRSMLETRNEAICAYRGDQGVSCAVGCLIPDERYDPIIEGAGVSNARVQELLPEMEHVAHDLLSSLQCMHDHCENNNFDVPLRIVACRYNLSPAVVDRLWTDPSIFARVRR